MSGKPSFIPVHFWLCFVLRRERCSFGRNKWLLCPLWGLSTYNSKLLLFLKTHLLQDFIAPFFRQTCISHFSPRNICIFLLFLFCSQTCTCILWRGSFQRCKQIQGWSWEFPRRGLRKKEYVRCKKCEAKYFLNFQKCFPDLCKYLPDQKNISWNSKAGPEKKMSDVRSPKQKYLPEFIFLLLFTGSTIHILHQYTIRGKYHGLLNHKETLLEWPTEMDIWSIVVWATFRNIKNLKLCNSS